MLMMMSMFIVIFGAHLRNDCGTLGLCSTCAELWEAGIDLEDMETEEDE